MKRINEQRPKAFTGTAISVGTSIVSGIIGNRKKKKAEQAERLRQERLQNLQDNQALASAQNENMMSEEERSQFLSQYLSKGGKVRTFPHKGTELRIVEGGTAIPIKKDSFLLKGRKHNTGGIVIDVGKTGVEAEGDEVVQITPKQLKVFSAQPILNGNSPAELVQKGAEPSKVFNAQEEFKDKNNLNDDGTKNNSKMKNGGIRKIYPSLSGRYYGKNEGRAIRSLREARSNPNYQYNGNNIPSMPSLNSELKPIERELPETDRETLLVIDATTGQNALSQAKEFSDVADITGIILTKMDGTAKGGIAVAIQAELGIPVKYIGVGETIDDLQKFDSDEFVQALFTTEEKKEEGEE